MFKAWLRHYFGFTAKESKGFLALCGLLVLISVSPTLYQIFRPETKPIHVVIQELKADSLLTVMESRTIKKSVKADPFPFDPNTADEDDLKEMGMPPFLAKRIVNYRNKGGKFKTKKDLRKIYGMPEGLYSRLEEYIQLPDSLNLTRKKEDAPKYESPKANYKALVIDINAADTSEWQKINGIGRAFSKRIVKFRDRLGGFASKEQLYEVYGLDSGVVQANWEKFELRTPCKKISVNASPEEELASHPYIGRKLAKVIVNYRKQHGDYQKAEDLLSIGMLEKGKWDRLRPYLEF